MVFQSIKARLVWQLLALTLTPLLISFILLFYAHAYSNLFVEHWVFGLPLLAIILAYSYFAYSVIIKINTRLKTLQIEVQNLQEGKFNDKFFINGQDELTMIASTIHKIEADLKTKSEFADQIRAGNFMAKYQPYGEHDVLGQSLVQMKHELLALKEEDQRRNWATEGLAKFVDVLRSERNLNSLSNTIIKNLVLQLKANQGAIFIAETKGQNTSLVMQACYAFNRTKHFKKTLAVGEGLIGQTYLEKVTVNLKEVPDDFVLIRSGLGDANPRNVLIVPLRMNEEVIGVLELASFHEFAKHEITFVEKIGENIAHTILSYRTAEHTQRLLEESQNATELMRSQEEELKQNQEELEATQEEISRKYNTLFEKLIELNHESRFDQLKSITSTKKLNVEYYFNIIRNQIQTFAENKMIINAVKELRTAFYKIDVDDALGKNQEMKNKLAAYYTNEFILRLQDNVDQHTKVELYLPTHIRTTILQYLYIADNPNPTGQKSLLDKAPDGSEYSTVHHSYHPTLRNFLEKFGYYDIFLIDPETGDMVYSVFKEVDFATSLLSGLYSTTNFGRLVKEAIQTTDKNFIKLVDFEPYDPSYSAPASFIACPIYEGEVKVGILVFQMPINKINQILTGDGKWREDGLGDSGETYIVGDDYKLRSISRGLLEDKTNYLSQLRKAGYNETVLRQIDKMNTGILLERVKSNSISKALQGKANTEIEVDDRNIKKLTASMPLSITDVHWAIGSSLKEEEASQRIHNLRKSN